MKKVTWYVAVGSILLFIACVAQTPIIKQCPPEDAIITGTFYNPQTGTIPGVTKIPQGSFDPDEDGNRSWYNKKEWDALIDERVRMQEGSL